MWPAPLHIVLKYKQTKATPKDGPCGKNTPWRRKGVRWHAVVIIVSSQATYNQVIDGPCSCILALGTNEDEGHPLPARPDR